MNKTDYDLIIKAQNGDNQAFEELVCKYDRHVIGIAKSFKNDEEDAKDIYQEVFMRVFRGLKNFQFKSEFSTWLFRIATNVCLTHKSQKRELESLNKEITVDDDNVMTIADQIPSDDNVEKTIINENLLKHINDALGHLPPKQKLVFSLKYFEEYKIKEIADMLQCTEGAVKSYLFAATHKMRNFLRNISLEKI